MSIGFADEHEAAVQRSEFAVVDGRPTVRGECDRANASRLKEWLAQFGHRPVEVDLSGVTILDAAAVDALLMAVLRNPQLRFVNPSPTVRRIITLSRTESLLGDGRDDAARRVPSSKGEHGR